MKTGLPRKQKGAVAIEFALVFIIFFAVFYGLVSYSLPKLNQVLPFLVLPGIGSVPNLPATLTARSSLQF
jgi:hypothetical protein